MSASLPGSNVDVWIGGCHIAFSFASWSHGEVLTALSIAICGCDRQQATETRDDGIHPWHNGDHEPQIRCGTRAGCEVRGRASLWIAGRERHRYHPDHRQPADDARSASEAGAACRPTTGEDD